MANGDFAGDLYGVPDLIGQQFSWPDEAVPVQITLGQVASRWLSLTESATATAESAATTELAATTPGCRPATGRGRD